MKVEITVIEAMQAKFRAEHAILTALTQFQLATGLNVQSIDWTDVSAIDQHYLKKIVEIKMRVELP